MFLHKTLVLLGNAKGAELCIVILESWQFTAVIFLISPPCGSQTEIWIKFKKHAASKYKYS